MKMYQGIGSIAPHIVNLFIR